MRVVTEGMFFSLLLFGSQAHVVISSRIVMIMPSCHVSVRIHSGGPYLKTLSILQCPTPKLEGEIKFRIIITLFKSMSKWTDETEPVN
jgi:hypothetical protein